MADMEKSRFKRVIEVLKKSLSILWKCFCRYLELSYKTPLGEFIELLKKLKEDHAIISGMALGVLSYIASQTNSDFILLVILVVIVYIVKKSHENKGENTHICPKCDEEFKTNHGLKIHDGKKH